MIPRRRLLLATLLLLCPAIAQNKANNARPVVLVIVGPPGSGKTEQSERLSKHYSVPVISVATMLQQAIGKKGDTARSLKPAVVSGDLAADQMASQLVQSRLAKGDTGRGFILDGYPRTKSQADFLDAYLTRQGWPAPKIVLLDASDEVVRERLRSRGRADDSAGNIEQRLQDYHAESQFLSEWYRTENLVRVDATPALEEVSRTVLTQVDEALARRPFAVREP